jgi:hypothetical protein
MSSKSKFVLTTDLVKVEPEPVQMYENEKIFTKEPEKASPTIQHEKKSSSKNDQKIEGETDKDQLSLKIDRSIKRHFQIWCVQHNKTMTQGIEEAINMYMKKLHSAESSKK